VQEARDATRFRDLTLAEFVDRLASSEPVPGGGSAAAVAASFGAALVTMVASLSQDRERYAAHEAMLHDAAAAGRALAARFLDLADADARAYGAYAAALKQPRDTDAERATRTAAIGASARAAAEVPLDTLRACLELVVAAERLAGRSNVNASSDVSVAALLADACARAAGANVLINLPATDDPHWAQDTAEIVVQLQAAVEDLALMTREAVGSGRPRDPIPPVDGE